MIKTKLEVRINESEEESLIQYDWIDFYFDPEEVSGFNESGEGDECTTVMFKGGERFIVAIPISWFEKRYPKSEEVVCARVKYELDE